MTCSSGILPIEWGEFEADSYEESEPTYLGMKITKVNNGEFGGVALDSNNYADEIKHIEIHHERTRAPKRIVGGRRTDDFAVGTWDFGADCAN